MFNFIERNYTTTKKKVLAMVDSLHKCMHYLLNNRFTFFVDYSFNIFS